MKNTIQYPGKKWAKKSVAIAIVLLLFGLKSLYAQELSLKSPDGNIEVRFQLTNNLPYWNVSFKNTTIIDNGLLGIELAGEDLSGSYKVIGTNSSNKNTSWNPVWGALTTVNDRYNELTIMLQEKDGKQRIFHTVLRAYNEGVACRYFFPKQPNLANITIARKLTEYRFNKNHRVYSNKKYEYGNVFVNSFTKSECNVTVEVENGCFASLTDADRSNFPQTFYISKNATAPTIVGTLGSKAEGDLPFQTSWDVLIVGETAAKLFENRYIVENLNPPCAIADPSWIRPGQAISNIRNVQIVTNELKQLMDFASKHNIEYLEIDHSWSGAETKWTPTEISFFDTAKSDFWKDKPEWKQNIGGSPYNDAKGWVPFRPQAKSGGTYVDFDVKEVAAYGNSLSPKVGLCVYLRASLLKEFGGEHAIEDVFKKYEQWGLAGVKVGFVPSASQYNERTITYLVKKAAEHKLILCVHDGYYPSGLSRTYPNLMNIEGVAGDEAEHSISPEIKSLHDVMLPFTRGLMGPLDYTPETGRKGKTHAHQMAMVGIYEGRTTIRGGLKHWAVGGEGRKEIEFLDNIPGQFDEKKVFTKLGEYVTVARRKGNNWYIATMGGLNAISFELPLNFIEKGKTYNAKIYSDTPGKQETTFSQQKVNQQSVISVKTEPNGGHLMILEMAK